MDFAILIVLIVIAISNIARSFWERRIAIVQRDYHAMVSHHYAQLNELASLRHEYRKLSAKHEASLQQRGEA